MAAWIEDRITLARKLHDGKCGGDYYDAVIILTSVISGIASRAWPGKFKDRKRFVETLVRFCPDNLNLTRISIPLLVQDLYDEDENSVILLRADFDRHGFDRYIGTRILTGQEIDKSESEILQIAVGLDTKKVRGFSYANLIYQEVRSGLVHEYNLTEKASRFPMADRTQDASYVNIADLNSNTTHRSIYFEYDWLEAVVESLNNSIDSIWYNAPRQDPVAWWIEG